MFWLCGLYCSVTDVTATPLLVPDGTASIVQRTCLPISVQTVLTGKDGTILSFSMQWLGIYTQALCVKMVETYYVTFSYQRYSIDMLPSLWLLHFTFIILGLPIRFCIVLGWFVCLQIDRGITAFSVVQFAAIDKGPFTLIISVNAAMLRAISLKLNCLNLLIHLASQCKDGLQPQLVRFDESVDTDSPNQSLMHIAVLRQIRVPPVQSQM